MIQHKLLNDHRAAELICNRMKETIGGLETIGGTMDTKPILFRRVSSIRVRTESGELPSSSGHGLVRSTSLAALDGEQQSSSSSSSTQHIPPSAVPGSGGQILDPTASIPIADEDPGEYNSAAAQHKRKLSGVPLEAEAIYGRASVQTSLERIVDEEEGISPHHLQLGGLSPSRSFSDGDLRGRDRKSTR